MNSFAMMLAVSLLVVDEAAADVGHRVDQPCAAVTNGQVGAVCAQQATSPPRGYQESSESDKRELAPQLESQD